MLNCYIFLLLVIVFIYLFCYLSYYLFVILFIYLFTVVFILFTSDGLVNYSFPTWRPWASSSPACW